ncbi:MAG TPA: GTP-binding protein [Candidatus Bathyarchaeota archaeon]|nr:GTP-binding protein [Candidatus Bathyarchaeota archaeon]HEW89957.1 GTP-binding protein [Candidatus Bathyarchaeota archaeon]
MKVLKVLMVGDGGVGKSTLVDAFRLGRFSPHEPTIGLSLLVCNVDDEAGRRYKLIIYDFSGQPRFFRLYYNVPSLMRGAHGAMLVFDLSSLMSLTSLKDWAELVKRANEDIPMILVGTKADLEHEVGEEEIRDLMEALGAKAFVRTSAKLMENVDVPFKLMVSLIKERFGL